MCNYMEGDYILDEYYNDHIYIPSALISVKNGYFSTSIVNSSDYNIKIKKMFLFQINLNLPYSFQHLFIRKKHNYKSL